MGESMDSNWFNQDSIPKYIVKAFEIANQYANNVKLVYNHNGGMEKIMWKKIMETIFGLYKRLAS